MLEFDPPEKVMNFGGKPIRLIYYSSEAFSEDEIAQIEAAKDLYKKNGEPVLYADQEILRYIYSNKGNIPYAIAALKARYDFRTNYPLPLKVNGDVFDLLQSGMVYI